jgi:prepilin-type N-terminal cleavage/methylation domain-containing protein
MNRKVKRVRRGESGFTLIELMIVIVILAILAGVVLFAVGGITNKGNVAACKADYSTIGTAAEAYYANNGSYPPNLTPSLTTAPNVFLRGGSFGGATSSVWNNTSGGYTITYAQQGGGTDYTLTSNLAGCP